MPPAGVPSGNGKYAVVAVLLLLGIGGFVFWKKSQKAPETTIIMLDAGPPAPTSARNLDDDIPLPPPVEDAGPADKPKVTTTKVDTGCGAKTCGGSATSDIETALAFRAKQAHRCYDNALAGDPTLRGKMSVTVRIGNQGQICSANVGQNDLPALTNCVLNSFRGQNVPAPRGGCVDVAIPINFVPRQ